MKQRFNLIKNFVLATSLAFTLGLGFMVTMPQPARAAGCNSNDLSLSSGINCGAPDSASKKGLFDNGDLFRTISDTLILVIGAVSVIMVIIGGLRYVLSAGNPSSTAAAKDTILYAVIGVIVAILAYAIVNFVLIHIG